MTDLVAVCKLCLDNVLPPIFGIMHKVLSKTDLAPSGYLTGLALIEQVIPGFNIKKLINPLIFFWDRNNFDLF